MTTRENDNARFDLRTLERKLRIKEIDSRDYEQYLKKLPDDAANADYIEVYSEIPQEEKTPHGEDLTFTV